ncbi:MAG: hypothetical protein QME96_00750 [Myxococcota bacterium]|nr:hypothetical protein [Myxococcota bacterium]
MRKRRLFPFLSVGLLAALACDDDPVAETNVVVVTLGGIKENDIRSGVIEESKGISTQTGNPYNQFIQTARARLGGNPGRIDVTAVSFTLDADSRGVASFADLFTAQVDVFFDAGSAGGTVNVGRVNAPTGTGPVNCELVADEYELAPIQDALLGGNFRVGIRGMTNRLTTDNFEARINIRLGFAAYR